MLPPANTHHCLTTRPPRPPWASASARPCHSSVNIEGQMPASSVSFGGISMVEQWTAENAAVGRKGGNGLVPFA